MLASVEKVVVFLYTNWHYFVYPVVSLAGGVLVGILLEKILLSYLYKLALRTKWKFDDILVESSKKILTYVFLLLGLYVTTKIVDIQQPYATYVNRFINVVAILLGTWYFARVLAQTGTVYLARIYGGQSSSLIRIIARSFVFGLGGLIALQKLGISITPILTALGVGGLAVALALQDTLTNFFSGIQILATKNYRPGDFIELEEGQKGYIVDISWRNITLKTVHSNLIIIPNAKFSQSIVKNYNFPVGEFTTPVTIGVHYDSNLAEVEKLTLKVAREVEKEYGFENKEVKPYMWYHTFNNSSIDFNVMLRTNDYRKHFRLKHEFIKRLHKEYEKAGIEIPYPITNLYFRNNLTTQGEGQSE